MINIQTFHFHRLPVLRGSDWTFQGLRLEGLVSNQHIKSYSKLKRRSRVMLNRFRRFNKKTSLGGAPREV